ncbi:endoplasmin-like [Glandiceps talaboti]
MKTKLFLLGLFGLLLASSCVLADDTDDGEVTVEDDIGSSRDASKTDDEVVQREEEAIKLDGLSVAQVKELREKAEKHVFEAEVDRMMKLIINSLYKNKEIFLRELISNSSDALDKIRLLSLTDSDALGATEELVIRIKADKENHMLHVTDTGIGMTKQELVKNLGTIAKSGTSEFLNTMAEKAQSQTDMSDMIGQFGVGFYSSFLVSERVIVTSKNNADSQYIWESDASEFSVTEDPRGDTLKRGTTVSLLLKEEAYDFLEPDTIKDLVKKYSQFINFPIYLWASKTEMVDEPLDEDEAAEEEAAEDEAAEEDKEETDEDDATVEEEEEEEKPKTKQVEKTTWDWELMNANKPIWTRNPKEITDEEYTDFYKQFTKEFDEPLAKTHFTAEGEVTFRSILYVPKGAPTGMFQDYGKKTDFIKMYVRRVFITDDFEDMMPKYLNFVRGIVDSDDLPLNVSRETLQQHKLLKVIKKKLVRKTLDMIKKMDPEDFKEKFWKEFGTNIKLGIIEDHSNRTRLAKLVRFFSSNSDTEFTGLADYVERMKEKQEHIYFMAGTSRQEVEKSPFVERLLKKGYEVLYLTEAVDEYCIQSLPEYDGKKFQNVAKEGLKLDESEKAKERREEVEKEYEPLLKWLKDSALNDKIKEAVVSQRLTDSPCALVASSYGWSGNMERIMKAQAYAQAKDTQSSYYSGQKKILEVNPRHPLVKELKAKIEADEEDQTAKDLAGLLFETAVLRSGYQLEDSASFAGRIERMLKLSLDIDPEAKVEEWPEDIEEDEEEEDEEISDEEEEEEEEEEELEVIKDEEDTPQTDKKSSKKKDELKSDCETCRKIAEAFREGIKRTAKGHFGGGNTAWEERALGSYANSETRFVEISETLCDKSDHKCHRMFEEHEEVIEEWWNDHREENEDLNKWFCIGEIKVCCPNNTYGPECKECPGGIERPCMGNGKCSGEGTRGGTGKCKCADGYKGVICEDCKDGYFEESKNNTHVICLRCHKACASTCWGPLPKDCDECGDGWEEAEEEGCRDIDECADTEDPPCDANQFCTNTLGSHTCKECDPACDACLGDGPDKCVKCKTGFHMKEGKCEDINECEELGIECDSNMSCYNDIGSYHCDCQEGYKRYGEECIEQEVFEELKRAAEADEEKSNQDVSGQSSDDDVDVVEGDVGSHDNNEDGGAKDAHEVVDGGGVEGGSNGNDNINENAQNVNSDIPLDDEKLKINEHNIHLDDIHKEL